MTETEAHILVAATRVANTFVCVNERFTDQAIDRRRLVVLLTELAQLIKDLDTLTTVIERDVEPIAKQ